MDVRGGPRAGPIRLDRAVSHDVVTQLAVGRLLRRVNLFDRRQKTTIRDDCLEVADQPFDALIDLLLAGHDGSAFGIDVDRAARQIFERLLNDLVATASGIPLLQAEDLHTLNAGHPVEHGTLAVIAPGTGLGEAFLTWGGTHYHTWPSEGGHVDFAPTNLFELELLRYMLTRFDHVSYELVCSGMGLPHIYGYLRDVALIDEPDQLAQQIARLEDPTPLIVRCALDTKLPSARCVATLETFTSILGAEAGNLVLKVLATGGIYLGGGIPPRILPFLDSERFTRAFQHKGRFSDILADIPLHVITNSRLALLGAAYHGFSLEDD